MYLPHTFKAVPPRMLAKAENCLFYHSMDFADGTGVIGPWDIRGRFDQYVGGVPLNGKTFLDVGTASGFLAFEAERAGATVTALESLHGSEYNQIHFSGLPFHEARAAHDAAFDPWLDTLKNSFWYGWHKNSSKVEAVYAPLAALPYWGRQFDVVLAGAILEHLADPVTTIWSLTMLARETVIIGFTPVIDDEKPHMVTANTWDNPANNFTWWMLSSGLYRRIFANVGFDMEVKTSTALLDGVEHVRQTIVATRIATKRM